ncbi:Uncharacterised protein [Myroides odoratus]|nr:hypothetical protein HMPREF9716_02711 [Myroides odoratus CIP 103059]STZ31492.1 Uncharacterised protein [Myroides odoratus]
MVILFTLYRKTVFNVNTNENDYVLIDAAFKTKNDDDDAKILHNGLYESILNNFHCGYTKVSELADDNFLIFQNNKK